MLFIMTVGGVNDPKHWRDRACDPKHWRDRAVEMRVLSTMIKDPETQTIMVRLADDYDKLAERTELRAARDKTRSPRDKLQVPKPRPR